MARVKPKANYKIFDKKTSKYVTASRSKATWTSEFWAMSAAQDYARGRGGKSYLENNIEIHIFPVETAIKVSWTEMIERGREEQLKKEEREKRRQEERKKKELEAEKTSFLQKYEEKKKELKLMKKRASQLGLTLEEDGSYVIRESVPKIKDPEGNTDWRDTGEMGG